MNNSFKEKLHVDVPSINTLFSNIPNEANLLLSKIGIKNLPENVQANISDDKKYLNIQLKDTKTEKHLLFQFPLEKTDLSALNNRSDYQELINRYNMYINDYVDEIKKYATEERIYLKNRFPGLVFNIKIRTKSYDSYIRKMNENILENKDPYINDIIAERIILSAYNPDCNSNENNPDDISKYQNEYVLRHMCDEVAKALYDFRINTNFRMKKDLNKSSQQSEKNYITKDYIENPKKNGYESIHILMEHDQNKDFTYETQIRTFNMENLSKTSGEIAHKVYKPRVLNDLSTNRVPMYYEITSFNDSVGNPIIVSIPLQNRFYHFYNSERKKNNTSITYKKFRDEQYILENLLGKTFKSIRNDLNNVIENSRDDFDLEK